MITSNIQFRIDNTVKYTIHAFMHYKSKNLDDTLSNARKACEAICRAIILNHKGNTIGEKIILGEINADGRTIGHRHKDGNFKIPLLDGLLKICQPILSNQPLYHRFQDIRYGGNNASHDALTVNSEVIGSDVDLCINQFKQILPWFWRTIVNQPLPVAISEAFEGKIDERHLTDFESSEWDNLYNYCNCFSRDQKFILIAPPSYDDLTENQLAVLGRINWQFVFDFNIKSKTDGLFAAIQHEIDGKQLKPITLEQKDQREILSVSNYSINWLFANGLSENGIDLSVSKNEKEWVRTLKYPLFIEKLMCDLLLNKINNFHFIFLWTEISYIRTIIEKVDAIVNQSMVKYSILYNHEDKLPELKKAFEMYDSAFFKLTISQITEGVARIKVSNNKSEGKQAFLIPSRTIDGNETFKDISAKYISFLDRNIEILYQGVEDKEENTKTVNSFYEGNVISWREIALGRDVVREKFSNLHEKIQAHLNLSKGGYTVELQHRTGAGGTTVAKKIAFEFHKKYPTILISKYQKNKTREAIFELAEFSQKPILVIIEAYQIEETELRTLAREVNSDKKHVVFLYIKRTFRDKIKEDAKTFFLNDKILDIRERDRFIDKYSQIASSKSKEEIQNMKNRSPDQCEVIDFALTAYEDNYSSTMLENYIFTYLNKLPFNQLQFVSFASLIYHYTQKSTSEYWLKNLFAKGSLSLEISDKPIDERFIKKLIIEEIDNEGNETGLWRPRFNRFANEILQLSIVGLNNRDNKPNWMDYLARWSVDFINFCKKDNQFLTNDLRDLLKSLFLNRDYEDVLGITEEYENPLTSNTKFAKIIRDIANKESQVLIFKALVDCFPDEAHFRGHLGRFYYEKALEPKEFDLAEEEIVTAIELGEKDYNLWHLKGMCNRRTIEYLIRSNTVGQSIEEMNELEDFIKELTEKACEDFAKSREINAYNLHSHTAQMQMLVKVINFGKDLLPSQSREDFITNKDNVWYEDKLNEIFSLIEEAEYIIEMSKDLDQSRGVIKSKTMISGCEATTFRILGDFSKAIDRFRVLSESAERSVRPYFRKMYVYSTLASKVGNNRKDFKNAWSKLSDYEFNTLKKALENNIIEQPENSQNFKLWLQAVRYSNNYTSLDDCISVVKSWYDNSSKFELAHLEATYYRYVLHASKAISEGDNFGEFDVVEAKKYIKECRDKTINDKFSFEWFGKGKNLKTVVNHNVLGTMNHDKGFFDDTTLLGEVEGTIVSITNRRSGQIKLKCGLYAFFVPTVGGFEKDKNDETTPVRFFVSFRYNELVAWEVKRINSTTIVTKPIEIDIEIEGFDEQEEIEAANIQIDENVEKVYSATPKLQGLTIVGKIDLSQFNKYKKNKL